MGLQQRRERVSIFEELEHLHWHWRKVCVCVLSVAAVWRERVGLELFEKLPKGTYGESERFPRGNESSGLNGQRSTAQIIATSQRRCITLVMGTSVRQVQDGGALKNPPKHPGNRVSFTLLPGLR